MKIKALTTTLGENKIDIEKFYQNSKLVDKTGIKEVFETNKTSVDLAVDSVNELIKKVDFFDPKVCIMVTQSPDDFLPANVIKVIAKSGLSKNILSFDFNQGCSGFVQAFCLCFHLINRYKEILLITCDRYRDKLDDNDRSTNAVFSDGSTAQYLIDDEEYKILYEDHITDGDKRDLLYQSVNKYENDGNLHMSGAAIWMFTQSDVVPQIEKSIKYCVDNNFKINGVYLHQASKLVVEGLKSMLSCDSSLIYANYYKHGNTVSSSIPFLIKDFPINLGSGEAVIMAGFGVGLTSTVLVYGKNK
mgnify:CR=1 FL=1|tara:strand:- start:563 stop:1471 length:909 start_codon:yes stop_codon:yes gene_type:complete